MYENGKMRHVKTIPAMVGAGRRMMEGVNSTMI
jgi:hypothetical protein